MRLDPTIAQQHADAFVAELDDGALERPAAGEGRIYEWQHHDGDGKRNRFGEHAERIGVADAECTFAYAVKSGRCHDDSVGSFGALLARGKIRAADGGAGERLEFDGVEEGQRGRGGDEPDDPAPLLAR